MTKIPTLKKRSEFLIIKNKGKSVVRKGFILQWLKRDDGNDMVRVGYTVSKKVGNAVERNRVKRRLRSVAAKILADWGAGNRKNQACDFVIIGRRGCLKLEFKELLADFERLIKKIKRDGDE